MLDKQLLLVAFRFALATAAKAALLGVRLGLKKLRFEQLLEKPRGKIAK